MDALRNTAGYDLDQRVQDVMKRLKLGEEAALEEITADSMLDVIGQEETMRRLMGEDKGLARKIMDWLGDIMRELQGMLKSLARYSPETNAMLKQQTESMQAIQEMYRKGMEQAAENYKAAQEGATRSAQQDANVQEYMAAMEAGEERQTALNALVSQLLFATQKEWLQANPEADLDEAIRRFADALKTYRRDGVALRHTLEAAGFAAPQDMTALSYAADQLMRMERDTGEAEVKYSKKEDYDYNTLINQKPMAITQVQDVGEKEVNRINAISSGTFAGEALADLKQQKNGSPVVKNEYSGRGITVTKQSYKHSINRNITKEYIQVSKNLKSILQNAIPVNELKARDNTDYSTIYIGIAETKDAYIAARFIVSSYTWKMRDYDVLYSITKNSIQKGGTVIKTHDLSAKPGVGNPSTMSIADVLQLVKNSENIAAVLSKDTANRLRINRPNIKNLSDDLKYSKKITDVTAQVEDDAALHAQVQSDRDARDALEMLQRLDEDAREAAQGAWQERVGAIADKILQETGSSMSRQRMLKMLRALFIMPSWMMNAIP